MSKNKGLEGNRDPQHEDLAQYKTPTDLGLRIAQVAKLVGGKKALSTLANVSAMQIHRYVSGENVPSALVLADIAEAGGVRLEWLAIGKGPMTQNEYGEEGVEPGFVWIESYQSSEAGKDYHMCKFAVSEEWLKSQGLYAKTLRLITAQGDAMEPLLRDSSLVLADISVKDLVDDGLYVLQLTGYATVRRLQRDYRGGVYIQCENPNYESQHLDAPENLTIIGKVVWAGGRVY